MNNCPFCGAKKSTDQWRRWCTTFDCESLETNEGELRQSEKCVLQAEIAALTAQVKGAVIMAEGFRDERGALKQALADRDRLLGLWLKFHKVSRRGTAMQTLEVAEALKAAGELGG